MTTAMLGEHLNLGKTFSFESRSAEKPTKKRRVHVVHEHFEAIFRLRLAKDGRFPIQRELLL